MVAVNRLATHTSTPKISSRFLSQRKRFNWIGNSEFQLQNCAPKNT